MNGYITRLRWWIFWRKLEFLEFRKFHLWPRRLDLSERGTLLTALRSVSPFENVLEVGSAFGQNLHLAAPLFPKARFLGIDRDGQKIAAAGEFFDRLGISNVALETRDAKKLQEIPDRSFDIVYTFALLLYLRPEELAGVLAEFVRIAGRRLFLLEQQVRLNAGKIGPKSAFVPRADGLQGYWLHDYVGTLAQIVPKQYISTTPVVNATLQGEQWRDLGTLITVDVEAWRTQ